MKKYFAFFNIGLQHSFEYRAEGFIWFLTEVFPSLVILFFWYAAFKTRDVISGYTLSDFITYYLGMIVMQALSTPHPEESMLNEIQGGALNFHLIRPFNIIIMRFFREVAWKIPRFLLLTVFIILVCFSLHFLGFPISGIPLMDLCLFFIGLIISFILQYLIRMTVSFSGFWLIDPGGVFSFFEIFVVLLSGAMMPLDLFPKSIQGIAGFLPFRFFYFFPLSLLMGKAQSFSVLYMFIIQILWIIVVTLLLRIILKRGLRVYGAFGG